MDISKGTETPEFDEAQSPTSHQPDTNRFLAALDQLEKQLADYDGRERQTNGFELLEVLCAITRERLKQGAGAEHLQFEPAQLVKYVNWSALDGCDPELDKSEIGKKIRPHRDNAKRLFDKLETGHGDLCREAGIGGAIELCVHSPGGKRPWQVWLQFSPYAEDASDRQPTVPPGGLRYHRQVFSDYRIPLLGLGIRLNKTWYLAVLLPIGALFLAGLACILLSVFAIRQHHWTAAAALTLVGGILAVGFPYFILGSLIKVKEWGVIMAPDHLLPIRMFHEMQLVYDPDEELVRAARYLGECPICHARVSVSDGGKAFPDRLIGRCRLSPREHVFSFDHALRVGEPLR